MKTKKISSVFYYWLTLIMIALSVLTGIVSYLIQNNIDKEIVNKLLVQKLSETTKSIQKISDEYLISNAQVISNHIKTIQKYEEITTETLQNIAKENQAEEGKLVKYNIQLENQANTDALTGLYNRRAFDAMMDEL